MLATVERLLIYLTVNPVAVKVEVPATAPRTDNVYVPPSFIFCSVNAPALAVV
ncbi:hypothetical protein [Chryseobacterium daeguense]|uniref:hypothetical protein n=1 Tax=Chryseobacterium daeguense TaxID=412438 RepID=UPI001E4ADEFB|nr:hypothetical protein [Chryseobacterium daeguense]